MWAAIVCSNDLDDSVVVEIDFTVPGKIVKDIVYAEGVLAPSLPRFEIVDFGGMHVHTTGFFYSDIHGSHHAQNRVLRSIVGPCFH
eukprot:scaffold62632_cov62-Attheya_sp.AAC.3